MFGHLALFENPQLRPGEAACAKLAAMNLKQWGDAEGLSTHEIYNVLGPQCVACQASVELVAMDGGFVLKKCQLDQA